jgi:hypothetical protein
MYTLLTALSLFALSADGPLPTALFQRLSCQGVRGPRAHAEDVDGAGGHARQLPSGHAVGAGAAAGRGPRGARPGPGALQGGGVWCMFVFVCVLCVFVCVCVCFVCVCVCLCCVNCNFN